MKRALAAFIMILGISSSYAWAESPPEPLPAKDPAVTEAPAPVTDSSKLRVADAAPKEGVAISPGESKKTEPMSNCVGRSKCCSGWLWLVALVPTILSVLFLLVLNKGLKDWSLGDALSESEPMKDSTGAIIKDSKGDPIFAKSASRLIAFVGLFVIIFWLIGMSIPTLYQFACTGEVPKLNDVSSFLIAQAGIFSPYIANKLVSAFKS